MTALTEWLEEIGDAVVLSVVETEHEAGFDPRCSICAEKMGHLVSSEAPEPSCGFAGYAMVPAAEIAIYSDEIGGDLLGGTGGAIVCCSLCLAEAKALAPATKDVFVKVSELKAQLEGGAA